jgi:hypothetical protein
VPVEFAEAGREMGAVSLVTWVLVAMLVVVVMVVVVVVVVVPAVSIAAVAAGSAAEDGECVAATRGGTAAP